MELKFFSIDEVKDFVKQLKGARGGKNDADDGPQTGQQAPAPLAPPTGQVQGFQPGSTGFAPPVGGAGPQGGAFPAAGAQAVAPEVQALVNRIVGAIDKAIQSGQPVEGVAQWFRGQCGPEAANFTLDQIKQVALPRAALPVLENIAKLMAA